METLCKIMQKISTNHKRILNSMVEDYGLTYAQYMVLKYIEENEQTLAQNIILALDSDKATISGILSRLSDREWIETTIDNEDRRKRNITLSGSGKKKLSKIHSLTDSCESLMLHSFSSTDVKKLKTFLLELTENQHQFLNDKGASHA